jgi:hypothetical protein
MVTQRLKSLDELPDSADHHVVAQEEHEGLAPQEPLRRLNDVRQSQGCFLRDVRDRQAPGCAVPQGPPDLLARVGIDDDSYVADARDRHSL